MPGVSLSTSNRMDVQGLSLHSPALLTCWVYPFSKPAVWMCRMYPFAPPAVWTCRVYPFPPPSVCTCRVYPFLQPAVRTLGCIPDHHPQYGHVTVKIGNPAYLLTLWAKTTLSNSVRVLQVCEVVWHIPSTEFGWVRPRPLFHPSNNSPLSTSVNFNTASNMLVVDYF
jgi:hypothetical protein